MSDFELFIKLVEVTIWPLTLLFVLFLFKKNFAQAFDRLGAIKADSTGLSLTFEKALEATKSQFLLNKPEEIYKSSVSVNEEIPTEAPYQQLMHIKESLDTALTELATEEKIETAGKSTISLCDELQHKGILTKQKGELTHALLSLINVARMDITQSQVNEIKKMYHAL